MKSLDLTKPLQTRDGRPAKFLHKLDNVVEYGGKLVFVVGSPGHQYVLVTHESGCFGRGENPDDLINVPVKHVREYWVNLYPETASPSGGTEVGVNKTKEMADKCGQSDRIACKKITIEFEEGEGL